MNSFYLIGFVQSLFFVLLILTKKNKNISDYFLSLFIFLLGGNLIFVYGAFNNLLDEHTTLVVFDIFYWVLLGPALVIYTSLIISGKNQFSKKYLLSFIPLLFILFGFSEYIFITPETFFSSIFSSTPNTNFFEKLCKYIWLYNTPLLFFINIWILKKHSARYKKYFSYSKNVDLKWLYFLSAGFALFLIFMHLNPYLTKWFNFNFPSSFSYTWIFMVLYIFGIGFYGYKQQGVFSSFSETDNKIIIKAEMKESVSYQKSGLSNSEAQNIISKLDKLMEDEKLYRNSEIDLSFLAEILETTTHKISQVINENLNKNFFDYINEYRVAEVKQNLLQPEKQNLTILAIAFESGFNSKSAFYNMFKKTFKMTPSEYRKQNQSEQIFSKN